MTAVQIINISVLIYFFLITCSVVHSGYWGLKNKVIVVTGGSKGIGKAVIDECLHLQAETIITCCRSQCDLDKCLADWKEKGFNNIYSCVADLSQSKGRQKFLKFIKEKTERVDCLINNVGFNIRKPTIEYTEDDYERVMNTNLKSCYFITQLLQPQLLKSLNGASVVNIGSVAGGCSISIKSGTIYAMTKAAMTQLSYNLACEWAKYNIRVNTVSPWYTETPLVEKLLLNPDFTNSVLDRTPLKRIGKVEEVASAVAYLCMDLSSYITGQNLAVDGGFTKYAFW